jgi:transcription initiation factor TFIIB
MKRVDRDGVDRFLEALHLKEEATDVADEACSIIEKAVTGGFDRGRNVEALMAAAVYAACRRLGVPVGLSDICRCTNANRRLVKRYYRRMLVKGVFDAPVLDYSLHVDRLLRKLDASMDKEILADVRSKALEIIERARSQGITGGRNPASLAAASLYIASDRRISQRALSEAAGVSEVTLRSNCKQLSSPPISPTPLVSGLRTSK